MKVTGWTWYDDPDYIVLDDDKYTEAFGIVAKEMRDRGYKFTGDYHQYGDYGVAIIDDKYLLQTSQRTWGHLMATAYPEDIDDSDGYGYCQWAWSAPEPMRIPDPNDYNKIEE